MGEIVKEMFDYMFAGGLFDQLVNILTANPSKADSIYYTAWELIVSTYDTYVVPIGLGLMIIWFLVAFVQKASSEQMNFDQIFLLFVKLIAAFYLMEHGLELFSKLWGFGNSLMTDLMGGKKLGDATISQAALNEAWKSLTAGKTYPDLPGFWRSLACFGQLLFPWLLCAALSGVASFIAYSRMIEMMLRVVAAPIALSDFFSEGLHSTGWRYIKTFLAICLQGFMILLIAKIYSSIVGKIITGGSFMELTVGFLVISFAAIALMFKSLSLCKEMVGA